MMEMISDQMKKNKQAKEQMAKQIFQDHFNRNQNIEKMFENTLQEFNDLQITQAPHGFIVVLDESGSMNGAPFQNCVNAIKEQVRYLKSKFPDDEFCMIQFGTKARVTINKSKVQYVNEADIGKTFNSGGTDFYQAFNQVKLVLPLFECKVINIMFVTDGGDSNTSAYLKVLREIRQEYPNIKFQLFGLAFGSSVSPDNIKDCLQEVNGNQLTINANGKKIQSYFEVNVAVDLILTFKKMFEAQSASVEEFNTKDKKRKELIAQKQVDAQKIRDTLLNQFDEDYGQLEMQLEKITEDNTNSLIKGKNALKEILNQQQNRLNSKIAEQEKEIQEINRDKNGYFEKINEIKNAIKEKEMQRDNYCRAAGYLADKETIQQNVKEYEDEICKLGFSSKNHYDQLKRLLKNADQIEIALINFSSEMDASMSHLNQIREFISEGIDQIVDNVETKEQNIQFQLDNLINRYMQQIGQNQTIDGLSPAEKIKILIIITSKDEYTRILEHKELNYPFDSLFSSFRLERSFQTLKGVIKKGKDQKDDQNMSVDQFVEKVFKELFSFKQQPIKIPGMSRIQEEIAKLDEKIEAEKKKDTPNESKIEQFQEKIEKLEQQLSEFEEKVEIKKEENEQKYQQFEADHRTQYDFTRNVIRNLHLAIKLIEYKSRQTSIFQPLDMQGFALSMLEQQCRRINQLAIE